MQPLRRLCDRCRPRTRSKPTTTTEADDATEEWVGPRDDSPTAPAPALFEPEVFD